MTAYANRYRIARDADGIRSRLIAQIADTESALNALREKLRARETELDRSVDAIAGNGLAERPLAERVDTCATLPLADHVRLSRKVEASLASLEVRDHVAELQREIGAQ